MKPSTKMNLTKLGFTTLEVEAVEQLIDAIISLNKEIQDTAYAVDTNERFKKINDTIGKEYSLSTQVAILRKALVSLGCTDEDFIAFNKRVEEIKKEIGE